jgi:hypothetical protein
MLAAVNAYRIVAMVVTWISRRRPDAVIAAREARHTGHRAKRFPDAASMQWRAWFDATNECRAGSIYRLADRATLAPCVSGPIVARTRTNPDVGGIVIPAVDLRPRITEISGATLRLRAE